VTRVSRTPPGLDLAGVSLAEAASRVLRSPAVADKTFLVAIGDRTVGGLSARDQCVGPWQVPVADCAATLLDFHGVAGEAFAVGERTPLAAIDAPASGRMAVAEALTNLAAAPVDGLGRVKLSANWMAAAGSPGEDAALFDTVRTVALEVCPALGVSIPVGKDSMSMRTRWSEGGRDVQVVSPVSLVVSAFAPCADVRETLTPQLRLDRGETALVLIDLAPGRARLGGSVLAHVFGQAGRDVPDLDDPARIRGLYDVLAALRRDGLVLAYHDRSDGGLFVTLCEMAFAGHAGVTIDATAVAGEADLLAALFAEELGAVLQVRLADVAEVGRTCRAHGLDARCVARVNAGDEVVVQRGGEQLFGEDRVTLQRAWSETTWQMQGLRDNPACAQQEYDRILDHDDPGISPLLTFDPAGNVGAPFVSRGARPRIAILREQGVNGHVEMAAAFDRAGFAAHDVHMSDLIAGRVSLAGFRGFVACGGFSYGDVLGAGEGWAKSILFNPRSRDQFEAFFGRTDTFGLGVCNGCQMLSNLQELIPGAGHWPHFVRNRSEQFEARLVMAEVPESPSILLTGMAGSRMPIVVSHGEGRAAFDDPADMARVAVALRYVDNRGRPTSIYPLNPNGSPEGITGVTTVDGRFTVLMPHPERVFRTVQMSWHPATWGEDSPWMRLFRNARAFAG
jgi:phosphoribosylformylglycinamidine synthase